MREFQERRRLKKFLHSRYAIALLVIVCLFMAKGVWGVYDKYERSKELAQRTKSELSGLEAREKWLIQGKAALETNQGKEREIRQRFGVVKEGEKMVVIVDNTALNDEGGDTSKKSWWNVLFNFFTGN